MAKAPPRQAFRKLVMRTIPGIVKAPYPAFIEPMHPTQHASGDAVHRGEVLHHCWLLSFPGFPIKDARMVGVVAVRAFSPS